MKKKYYKSTSFLSSQKKGKVIGFFLVLVGLIVLAYFFFPIVSYQLFISRALAVGNVETPVPKRMLSTNQNDFANLISRGISQVTTDYTDARNWFPQVQGSVEKPQIDAYQLSIPKLGVKNATVSLSNYDLSQNLVQYYGTSNPPENGTSVIYGHSSLPQLFDPNNYKSIFATVHNIEIDDQILIHVNDETYSYRVFSIGITEPEDTNIFSQSYDNSYITLVTCTPPGTIWKRLIVRASLEKTAL